MTPPAPAHLLSVARAFRPIPGPDGGLWFASDMPGFSQVYRIAGPDRFPVRLAPGQDRMLPVGETPFGLLVRRDQGGDETWQLALLEAGGGLRAVTHDAKAIHRDRVLSPEGRRVGLSFNPGGQSDWVLGSLDLETGEIERWLDAGGNWDWLAWSPGGATAAVVEDVTTRSHHSRAYLLERGGERRQILADALLVADVTWAGDRLLALTDLDREFAGLVEVGPDGALLRRLVDEDRDVLAVIPDPSGRRVAAVVNEGAYDSIRVLDLESGAEAATETGAPWRAALPEGVVYVDNASRTADHLAWSPDGARLFVAWESPVAPAEIYELPSGARW